MKQLPLTLLLVDTIPANIYLALLKKNNLRPKKIIKISSCGVGPKRRLISRLFGRFFGFHIIKFLKSKRLSKPRNKEYGFVLKEMLSEFNLSETDVKECLKGYSSKEIKTIYCNSINDVSVKKVLEKEKNKIFLFTGGGILSDDILAIPDSKFFHIHPGIVPEIRGADCFFWSCLIKGRPGYSVFYMNAGIDTGDILYKREYKSNFSYLVKYNLCAPDIKDLILSYYDPCLRITAFIEMLNELLAFDFHDGSLSNLPTTPQDEEDGRMYFFMHDLLMEEVVKKIICPSKTN